MIKRILEWFAVQNARLCKHPGNEVVADINKGQYLDSEVQYCRCCGSVRQVWFSGAPPTYGEWRLLGSVEGPVHGWFCSPLCKRRSCRWAWHAERIAASVALTAAVYGLLFLLGVFNR